MRIHFWHPNVSSLNLSTSCCAMLPHVPNLFSASDGAAFTLPLCASSRRGPSSAQEAIRPLRFWRRFLPGWIARRRPDRPRCCLLDPHAPLAVSRSLLQPPPSPPPFSSKFYRVTASISCNACIIFKSDFNSWLTGIKKVLITI